VFIKSEKAGNRNVMQVQLYIVVTSFSGKTPSVDKYLVNSFTYGEKIK
jgi:hypothetical protein